MFNNNLTTNYERLDATFEILIMLAGAFLLGALFCWAMGKLRGNKNNRKAPYQRKTVDHQNGFRQPVQQAAVAISHAKIPSTSSPAIKQGTETGNTSIININKKTKSAIIKPPSEVKQDTTADDLKKIEGIDQRTENTLYIAGIKTYAELRATSYDTLKQILSSKKPVLNVHDAETWPYQADLAYNNKWQKLKEYQDFLIGGEK